MVNTILCPKLYFGQYSWLKVIKAIRLSNKNYEEHLKNQSHWLFEKTKYSGINATNIQGEEIIKDE